MDPVTHTLVGATLAQTGLKKKTALGTATLLIGSNLPDIDVLSYLWGPETALSFRRGLTHGVVGLVVLPVMLTGLVLLWDRAVRRRRGEEVPRVEPRQVWLLAALAVATHPLLDSLNVYGMRWLAPFSYRWFYGDALFIIDPWLWLMLGAGMWVARRWAIAPRVALAAACLYVGLMALSSLGARRIVEGQLSRASVRGARVMVAPLVATPFTGWVVVERAGGYQVGMFRWLAQSKVELQRLPYDSSLPAGLAGEVSRHPAARKFLSWARFPYYLVERPGDGDGGYTVYIADARYTVDPKRSWAAIRVRIPSGG